MERRHHLHLQINLLAEQSGALTLRLSRRVCERMELKAEDVPLHSIDDLLSDEDSTRSWRDRQAHAVGRSEAAVIRRAPAPQPLGLMSNRRISS